MLVSRRYHHFFTVATSIHQAIEWGDINLDVLLQFMDSLELEYKDADIPEESWSTLKRTIVYQLCLENLREHIDQLNETNATPVTAASFRKNVESAMEVYKDYYREKKSGNLHACYFQHCESLLEKFVSESEESSQGKKGASSHDPARGLLLLDDNSFSVFKTKVTDFLRALENKVLPIPKGIVGEYDNQQILQHYSEKEVKPLIDGGVRRKRKHFETEHTMQVKNESELEETTGIRELHMGAPTAAVTGNVESAAGAGAAASSTPTEEDLEMEERCQQTLEHWRRHMRVKGASSELQWFDRETIAAAKAAAAVGKLSVTDAIALKFYPDYVKMRGDVDNVLGLWPFPTGQAAERLREEARARAAREEAAFAQYASDDSYSGAGTSSDEEVEVEDWEEEERGVEEAVEEKEKVEVGEGIREEE